MGNVIYRNHCKRESSPKHDLFTHPQEVNNDTVTLLITAHKTEITFT